MSQATFFVRECPICGRRLQIKVTDLGRRVSCLHCRGKFTAYDQCESGASAQNTLLTRVHKLLQESHKIPIVEDDVA